MTSASKVAAPATRGSTYRWVILLLSWLAFTMTSVDRATWGPASLHVGESLGVAVAGLGVFATAYYIGYVVSNALGGLANDWFGPRWVLSATLFVAGALMIAFGESTSTGVGIALQAAIGLFAGADYSSGIKLIRRWFPTSGQATAIGVYMTATSLGTVVANAVVPTLIVEFSWRASYHVFGIASMVVAVACAVFVRGGPVGDERPDGLPDVRVLARNRDLVLVGIAGFGALWGTYGFITWSNALMIKGSGVDPVQAGFVVVVFGVAAIVSKPLIGLVSDLMGGRRKLLTLLVLAGFVVTLLAFGSASGPVAFFVIAPFLGVFAYVYSPLMIATVASLVDQRHVGSAAGASNAFWQLGSAVVPVAVGAVFQATGSFLAAFVSLAAGPLVAFLVMLAVRVPDYRTLATDAGAPAEGRPRRPDLSG